MDQLTNLNGEKVEITNFSNINKTIEVTNENTIFINNEYAQAFENNITFNLLQDASLEITLFDLNSASSVQNNLNFKLGQDSKLKVVIVSLNENVTNSNVIADLDGTGAVADINVISVANSGVNTTFNVVCNNNAPHTNGNITQRAVALNGGQNIFEATGYIGKDCSKAVNFQESRVLLLDGAAKGDASPILLINHHDVEAGHAAGVSRVNDEEMYYLMSRGINRKTAEELMTIAFIRPVVDRIENEQLRESVFEKISKKASYENN